MLLRESLGISADGSEKAFHTEAIANFIKRKAPMIPYNVRTPENNTSHFFVAVDPSGGGASAFSIASVAQDPNGFVHVRFTNRIVRNHLGSNRNHLGSNRSQIGI